MPKSTTTVLTTPPAQSEFIIERDPAAKPDDFGRTRFFAYWHDAKTLREGGPPDHTRGQIFFTDLEKFVHRAEADGKSVRYVTDRPEFTPRGN